MAHEFMFGPSLLVAPVVKALFTPEKANQTNEISGWDPANKSLFQEGFRADWSAPKTYDVYLPAGAEWYDYWTGQRLQGGQTVKADAPLAHSPLYVRAGSIVPLCKKEVNHADVADWQSLDIQVYPGRDADFTLYEDEGDGYGYEQGQRSTIRLHWNDRARRLTIDRRQGNFPGMSVNRSFNVNVVGGKSQTVSYSGKAVTVKF
jgi:alpha-D-xyloside xylohydrolase